MRGLLIVQLLNCYLVQDYDKPKTELMEVPNGIRGAAFQNANGNCIYVLWAETSEDRSEIASGSYSFPASFGESQYIQRNWDYSQSRKDSTVSSNNIMLTGAPIFLLESTELLQVPLALFSTDDIKGCAPFTTQFNEQSLRADTYKWTFPGGTPSSSIERNPIVTYSEPGVYEMTLEVSNAVGTHRYTRLEYITSDSIPTSVMEYTIDGAWVQFNNESINATKVKWNFGDGSEELSFDPNHFYFNNGDYTVQLIAENECGFDTTTQLIIIQTAPVADFQFVSPEDCEPFDVQFQDLTASSPTSWAWTFEGGQPASSSDQNPVINFAKAGSYDVQLIVSNENGADTIMQTIYLSAGTINWIEQTLCVGEELEVNGIKYDALNPNGTQVLSMAGQQGCDSLIVVELEFLEYLTTLKDTIDEGQNYTIGDKVYSTTGIYTDTLQSQEGCDSIIILDLTVLTTSTRQPLVDLLSVEVFPNPFTDHLTIDFGLPNAGETTVELIDIYGRKAKTILESTALPVGSHQFGVDTADLASGVYYIRLTFEKQMATIGVVHFSN